MQMKKIFPLCLLLLALTFSCKKKGAEGPSFLVEGTISYENLRQEADSDNSPSDTVRADNQASGTDNASTDKGKADAKRSAGHSADSITRIIAFVQRSMEEFDVDTIPVVNGRFAFRHPADTLLKVNLVAGDRYYAFYVGGADTIRLNLAPDSLVMSGNDSPYARWSIKQYDGLPADTGIVVYPAIIRSEIAAYKSNIGRGEVGKRIQFALMKDIDGGNVSSVESRGCYRLYTFWASWDSRSVAQVKQTVGLAKQMKGKAIDFVNVSLDTNDSIWRRELKALNLPGRNVRLKSGLADEQLAVFGVTTIPATTLLDVNSIVVERNLFGPALEAKIKERVTIDRPKEANKK
jgi:hypothetical protein